MMKKKAKLQPAAWVARAAVGAVVAAVAVLGFGLEGERGRYREAVGFQRHQVASAAASAGPVAPSGERELCARGATGFASAAAAGFGQGLRDADGVIVPASLAAVSGAAIEANRWAEQGGFDGKAAGPALPQRIGLDDERAQVAPPETRCGGDRAYALARISGRGLPAVAATSATPVVATKKKPAKKKKAPSRTRPR